MGQSLAGDGITWEAGFDAGPAVRVDADDAAEAFSAESEEAM